PIDPTCRSIKRRQSKIMNDALAAKLKYLHLGELLTHWDDYLKLAAAQHFSHGRLLTHILEELYRVKRERLRELRLRNLSMSLRPIFFVRPQLVGCFLHWYPSEPPPSCVALRWGRDNAMSSTPPIRSSPLYARIRIDATCHNSLAHFI